MHLAVQGNIAFSHIEIIPAVKRTFKPPLPAMIDPDYILLFTASETALRRKIYNHELYSRKNVIQPHIGGAILYLKIHIGHKGFLPRYFFVLS